MTNAHVLDRPVWSALSTRQQAVAVGGERARRFAPDIGPLAAARDEDEASLAALGALVPEDGTLLLLQADPIVLPPSVKATTSAAGVQLVLAQLVDAPADAQIVPLGPDDAPAMQALAALTKPGPFAPRTPTLGEFFGVKHDGVLVAMAGERTKPPGFTEVSGVCTHPDARGRGYARALSAHVVRNIVARGDTPFLHAYASNTAAIALYESLGFRHRCAVNVAVIARA
jgi:predicted GNAT family acetyltransferase